MNIPQRLQSSLGEHEITTQWLDSLEGRVAGAVGRWSLTDIQVLLPGGYRGLSVGCRFRGQETVLKIVPEGEEKAQVHSLIANRGGALVKLREIGRGMMLIERLEGRTLKEVDDWEYLDVVGGLMDFTRSLRPAYGTRDLDKYASTYNRTIRSREKESIVAEVISRLRTWDYSSSSRYVLHGDLHDEHVFVDKGVRVLDPDPIWGPLGWECEPLLRRWLDRGESLDMVLEVLSHAVSREEVLYCSLWREGYYYSWGQDVRWVRRIEGLLSAIEAL